MVTGIEHTAIASPDPQRLAHWYVDCLGFTINYQSKNSRTVFVRTPEGAMIEIIEADGPVGQPAQMNDAGLRHLALKVADFPDACRRLQEKGVTFLTEPVEKAGTSTVFFRDPDGNILHLLHRQSPFA